MRTRIIHLLQNGKPLANFLAEDWWGEDIDAMMSVIHNSQSFEEAKAWMEEHLKVQFDSTDQNYCDKGTQPVLSEEVY